MENAPRHAVDGAKIGMAGTAMPDGFIANPIFLFRERQCDKSGGQQVGVGTREGIQRP